MARREKYNLVGVDGNAFSVIGYVRNAMRECKRTAQEIQEYSQKAMSGDYNNLLCVSMDMVERLNKSL